MGGTFAVANTQWSHDQCCSNLACKFDQNFGLKDTNYDHSSNI